MYNVFSSPHLHAVNLKLENFSGTPICLPRHISADLYRRGHPMEVIDDCMLFFFGILPLTLRQTGTNSSPRCPLIFKPKKY